MKFKKIKETCVYVNDLDKIRDFYAKVLGLAVIGEMPGKHIFFRAGESVLLFFNPQDSKNKKSPPAHYGGGKQHFAFEVSKADYLKTKSEISKAGIDITEEVTWRSGEKSFYFEDPAGNILEVVPDEGIWN
jgi:catechol 2,3-dioxygenase-like lactoylglutathione lyase family enzyme